MSGILWLSLAFLLSMLLSIIVAVRELRRRNFLLGGFALVCLAVGIVAGLQPIPTHAVKIDLPARDDAR